MVVRDPERFVDAFLDRDRWHDDDELAEAITFVQLEYRAQVDIGLARACFHLHGKIAGVQGIAEQQAAAELDSFQVTENFIIGQDQPVADAEVSFGEGEPRLSLRRIPRDGELGPTDLLAAEQVAHGFDRLELKVEIGFEMEFHFLTSA